MSVPLLLTIDIRSVEDFTRATAACTELIYAEAADRATLRLRIHPGRYKGLQLTLGSRFATRPLDLALEAADPARPPVLEGGSVQLTAARLTVSNLVFTGERSAGYALHLNAHEEARVEGVSFVDCRASTDEGAWSELGTLKLEAQVDGLVANLMDCWFVGNQGTLLTLGGQAGTRFETLQLERIALIGNRGSPAIDATMLPIPAMRGCLIDARSHAPLVLVTVEAPVDWMDTTWIVDDPSSLTAVAPVGGLTLEGGATASPADAVWLDEHWIGDLVRRLMAGERSELGSLRERVSSRP